MAPHEEPEIESAGNDEEVVEESPEEAEEEVEEEEDEEGKITRIMYNCNYFNVLGY